MKALKSSVSIVDYQQEIIDAFRDESCNVFIDTNIFAWSFQLNNDASREFMEWLNCLAESERLAIPAWVVHEYNHHLRKDDINFFSPYRPFGKRLKGNLKELDKTAHLMITDASAQGLGYQLREDLLIAIADASKRIEDCIDHLTEDAKKRKKSSIESWERLINQCALKSDIHKLSGLAEQEASSRYLSRLSPGQQDEDKNRNSVGDFIIWKEILEFCKSKNINKTVFITNDSKSDWVYLPRLVKLLNGKEVANNPNSSITLVRLPNPDLVAEFELVTGSNQIHILSIEAVIEALSSEEFDFEEEKIFRHLTLAVRQIKRTPTEMVIQWFRQNPDLYEDASSGICYWDYNPGEVSMDAFKDWTARRMRLREKDLDEISWTEVFCDLFL